MLPFRALATRYPRTARWGQAALDRAAARSAWLVCALCFAAAWAIADDFVPNFDLKSQYINTMISLDYIWGRSDDLLTHEFNMYGIVFEAPLLWIERLFGLQDRQQILWMRHLLTHLLFLASGLGAHALVFRMYGSRLIALSAMVMFLLHPRIYDHTFWNSKDAPFLSLFMLALCLIHWAFRRGSVKAFLLCGIGVGLCTNARLAGLMLAGAVPILRMLDWAAADPADRRSILQTVGAFVAACALTIYALFPYLWGDPLRRLTEMLAYISDVPVCLDDEEFRGRLIESCNAPLDYVPVWFLVTTPPIMLGLGFVGLAEAARRGLRHPRALARNTPLRFRLLLLVCFVAPVLTIIGLRSTIFADVRHTLFINAPFCLLAASGLYAALTAMRRLRRGREMGALLAMACMVAPVGATVAIQPITQAYHARRYFNFLAPYLQMGPVSYLNSLQALAAAYPDGPINLYRMYGYDEIERLAAPDRQRFNLVDLPRADFYIRPFIPEWRATERHIAPYAPILYQKRFPAHVTLALNLARVDAATAAPYYARYRRLKAEAPTVRTPFDVYLDLDERTVSWIKKPCRREDLDPKFLLHVTPKSVQDLPPDRRRAGFDNRDFYFFERGVRLDGDACMAVRELPSYPIARLSLGQWHSPDGPTAWTADIDVPRLLDPLRNDYRAAYRALTAGTPALRAAFDVYVTADEVAYAKTPCTEADTQPKFILHVIPARRRDLPPDRRRAGFDNQDFPFVAQGAHFDGICLALAPLPAYPIDRLRVGQFHPGADPLWMEEIPLTQ